MIAVVLVVAVIGGGLGYLRAWPPLATVMSASMSPSIDTGDLVVMRRIDGAPQVGDVVAVTVPDEARSRYGYPPQVIHRIVGISPDGRITTKGDARDKPDPFSVRRSAVQAEVVATVPAAGRGLSFLTSTLGLIWLAGGVLLLVVMPFVERQRDHAERDRDGIEALRGDVQAVLEEVVRLQGAVRAEAGAREALERHVEQLAAAAAVGRRRSGGLLGRAERRPTR